MARLERRPSTYSSREWRPLRQPPKSKQPLCTPWALSVYGERVAKPTSALLFLPSALLRSYSLIQHSRARHRLLCLRSEAEPAVGFAIGAGARKAVEDMARRFHTDPGGSPIRPSAGIALIAAERCSNRSASARDVAHPMTV